MFLVCAPTDIQYWMSDPHSNRSLLIITQPWPEYGRGPTLINLIEKNLTVKCRGSSNNHIFVVVLNICNATLLG